MLEILVTSPLNVFLISKCGHGKFLFQKRWFYRMWKLFLLYYIMCATHARTIPSSVNCKNNDRL